MPPSCNGKRVSWPKKRKDSGTATCPSPPPVERPATIEVSARSLEVFKAIFYVIDTDADVNVSWDRTRKAMGDAGFQIGPAGSSSAFVFAKDGYGKLNFHRPHGRRDGVHVRRKMGRQLTNSTGLTFESFVEKPKAGGRRNLGLA